VRPDLRAELLRRAERDQEARSNGARVGWQAVSAIDAENLAWLAGVVADVGWPGKSMVGDDGAHAAWLLAQHADGDPAFQRVCLDLLAAATVRGDAAPRELAYLTDRVLLAEGQPQLYGTQCIGRDGQWVPRRLRDPGTVDDRRAAMSLPPLADYTGRLGEAYGPPAPATVPCGQCGSGVEFWPPEDGTTYPITCRECGWTTTVAMDTPRDRGTGR